ncbi:MAG: GNAT family N-acetyltransferase [Planctomycetota bacterium]
MNDSPSEKEVMELPPEYVVRPASADDLVGVVSLLQPYIDQELLLRRSEVETAALLPTGFVAVYHAQQGEVPEIVGFCAIEIYSKKLSEIQCLAVSDAHRSHGLGGILVGKCIDLANQRGVMEVMAISSSEDFLQRLGFDYSLPKQKRALFYQLRDRKDFDGLG